MENKLEFFAVVNGRLPIRLNRLVLSADLQKSMTSDFQKQADTLCKKTRQVFSSSYRVESDESLFIEDFRLPDLYKDILQRSDSLDKFSFTTQTVSQSERKVSVKAIFGVEQTRNGADMYFQSLSATRVLFQKNWIVYSSDTFSKMDSNGLILDTKLAAAYKDGDLIFTSYRTISPFLDIADYFHAATEEEIKETLSDSLFHCDDALLVMIASNADEWMRKRFSGLRTLLPEISKNKASVIVDKARKYGIDTNVIKSGGKPSISVPKDLGEVKKFLAFLNEEMHTGELTGTQYKSNSQIAIP